MTDQQPNRARRAAIVIGALGVSLVGLIWLNMLAPDEVTLINQRSAEGFLDIFLSTVGLYVFGSVAPSVVKAYSSHTKAKVTNNYANIPEKIHDELHEDAYTRGMG